LLIVIGAGHEIAALLAKEFALALCETAAADGAEEHRFGIGALFGFRLLLLHRGILAH
jgi:hypothetical protein